MKKCLILPVLLVSFCFNASADKGDKIKNENIPADSSTQAMDRYLLFRDSVSKAVKYETGVIDLKNSNAVLNIPKGFKFIST